MSDPPDIAKLIVYGRLLVSGKSDAGGGPARTLSMPSVIGRSDRRRRCGKAASKHSTIAAYDVATAPTQHAEARTFRHGRCGQPAQATRTSLFVQEGAGQEQYWYRSTTQSRADNFAVLHAKICKAVSRSVSAGKAARPIFKDLIEKHAVFDAIVTKRIIQRRGSKDRREGRAAAQGALRNNAKQVKISARLRCGRGSGSCGG